jgi:hypothetical protein
VTHKARAAANSFAALSWRVPSLDYRVSR